MNKKMKVSHIIKPFQHPYHHKLILLNRRPLFKYKKNIKFLTMTIFKSKIITKSKNKKVQSLMMQYEEEDLPPHIHDPYAESVDDGHEVEPRETLTSIMPRVAGHVDVDQILTGISKSRVTCKHLINFCAHFSFVSSVEPHKVHDALIDNDWLVAMQEELNNFECNKVW